MRHGAHRGHICIASVGGRMSRWRLLRRLLIHSSRPRPGPRPLYSMWPTADPNRCASSTGSHQKDPDFVTTRVLRSIVFLTSDEADVRDKITDSAMSEGRHNPNLSAAAKSPGSSGCATAGYIAERARRMARGSSTEVVIETPSQLMIGTPASFIARAIAADAKPPAKIQATECPVPSDTIAFDVPSMNSNSSWISRNRCVARCDRAQPASSPATILCSARLIAYDSMASPPSHRDRPPPSAGTTETRLRGQSTLATRQLRPPSASTGEGSPCRRARLAG